MKPRIGTKTAVAATKSAGEFPAAPARGFCPPSAGRQYDRREFLPRRAGRQAFGAVARASADGHAGCTAGQPTNENIEGVTKDVVAAAATLGVQIDIVRASDSREIEAAFATLVRNKVNALLIGPDVFCSGRRVQLATLTARHAIPAVNNVREFAEVGGLMSYGTDLTEVFRQLGVYTGRILKGAEPADLPVVQSTKFQF